MVSIWILHIYLVIQVLRRHGDVFERNAVGYYRAHGRADDTMNLGGIKVSSAKESVENLWFRGLIQIS